jgi:hypothetical protein
MSRLYRMEVSITKFDKEKRYEIEAAADEEWGFDWEGSRRNVGISGTGEGNLCGGESEEQFSKRLARAIFEANGGPCGVKVACIYLEDPPTEHYNFGDAEYASMGIKPRAQDEE